MRGPLVPKDAPAVCYAWCCRLAERSRADCTCKAAGRYCQHDEATKQTAVAAVLEHLQGCQESRGVGMVEAADADKAIEKAAKQYKVPAYNLIAVRR